MSAARTLLLAIACLAVLPAAASGATAKIVVKDSCDGDLVCSKYGVGSPVPVVTYLAASGEANRVVVARAGDIVTISDPGAAIAAEPPCRAVDAHKATCAASRVAGVDYLAAKLGDGDDTVAIANAGSDRTVSTLDGGDGSDTLTGGHGEDTLVGGLGADRLDGRVGDDVLSFSGRADGIEIDLAAGRSSDGDVFSGVEQATGGDGADRLLGGPASEIMHGGAGADTLRGGRGGDLLLGDLGADLVEGGGGDDFIVGDPVPGDGVYSRRVRLSRDVLRGGAGDHTIIDTGGDNLIDGGAGIDNLGGGAGRDRITGGPGTDGLDGGSGADDLRGGAGGDVLDGEAGRDVLRGGAGGDTIAARDGRRDRVHCGSGRDSARIDRKDRVRACETQRPRRYTSQR